MMRSIKYKRHEFHQRNPSHANQELHRFLLDIPYLLYFGVVPSREVINEVLRKGGGDGGMSPGASWSPFQLTEDEYWEVVGLWDQMDVSEERDKDHFRFDPMMFVQDHEIMSIHGHLEYLNRSREKYESFFCG